MGTLFVGLIAVDGAVGTEDELDVFEDGGGATVRGALKAAK